MRALLLAAGFSVLIAGCSAGDSLTVPVTNDLASSGIVTPADVKSSGSTLDDVWLRWSLGPLPGFAGFYRNDSGEFVVMTSLERSGDKYLRAVLDSVAGGDPATVATMLKNVKVLRVEYSFAQLAAWRSEIVNRIGGRFAFDADVDEVRNKVVLHAWRKDRAALEFLASAAAVPLNAVQIGEAARTVGVDGVNLVVTCDADCPPGGGSGGASNIERPLPIWLGGNSGFVAPAFSDTFPNIGLAARFQAIPGGVILGTTNNISPYPTSDTQNKACTVGFPMAINGISGFLTAEHCAIANYSSAGTTNFLQGFIDDMFKYRSSYFIGNSRTRPLAVSCASPGGGAGATECFLDDVQFVPVTNRTILTGCIAKPTQVNVSNPSALSSRTSVLLVSDPCGFLVSKRIIPAAMEYVGQTVDKVGIKTGWTRGSVYSTCVFSLLTLDDGTSRSPGFPCQNTVKNTVNGLLFGDSGDSGAPIFANGKLFGILSSGKVSFNGVLRTDLVIYAPLIFGN